MPLGVVAHPPEFFNVQSFGAVGDGTTNDRSKIEATIDAAIAAGGGTIYFPPGYTYYISSVITKTAPAKLTFYGPGAVIKGPGGAGGQVFYLSSATDIRFLGLAFDMNALSTFGGLAFYACQRVWFTGCRFYDSNAPAVGGSDRYAVVFGVGGSQSKDIWFTDNFVDGLQVEIDYAANVHVQRNIIKNSVKSGAVGIFSRNDSLECAHFDISDNIIIDPVGPGISVVVDPPDTDNGTFTDFKIHDNILLFTTVLASGAKAILVGTGNAATATTGNVFEDVQVYDNVVLYKNAAGTTAAEPLFFNNGATANLTFRRPRVEGNTVTVEAAGSSVYGIRVVMPTDGRIAQNEVGGTNNGIAVSTATDTTVHDNVVDVTGTAYDFSDAAGGCRFQENRIKGSPTTTYTTTGWSGSGNIIIRQGAEALSLVRASGLYGESIPRNTHLDNVNLLTSGRLALQLIWLPIGTLTNITFVSGTTAVVTPANQWFALYNTSLALLRQTANDTTTAWAANTVKTLALTSTYTITVPGLYYVGVMVDAATVPSLVGATHQNSQITNLATIAFGLSTTGLTTTAPDPAAALTAQNAVLYCHVS